MSQFIPFCSILSPSLDHKRLPWKRILFGDVQLFILTARIVHSSALFLSSNKRIISHSCFYLSRPRIALEEKNFIAWEHITSFSSRDDVLKGCDTQSLGGNFYRVNVAKRTRIFNALQVPRSREDETQFSSQQESFLDGEWGKRLQLVAAHIVTWGQFNKDCSLKEMECDTLEGSVSI